MAAMFPSTVCKILLVSFTVVALLFAAGEAARPWEAELIKDYHLCQSIRSRLVKPNCFVWCQHIGFIKGGKVTRNSCCCTE